MTQQTNMTAVEWLIDQLRQLSHSLEAHLGTGDIRVTQGMIDDFEEQAKQMEKKQTVISDEEIEKLADEFALKYYTSGVTEDEVSAFVTGMKWYREQLKKKQI